MAFSLLNWWCQFFDYTSCQDAPILDSIFLWGATVTVLIFPVSMLAILMSSRL